MGARWTDDEHDWIRYLIKKGHSTPEIAKIMGRSRTGLAIQVQRVIGGNPNYRNRITKHKHLRGKLLRYYKNHSADECQKYFGLTSSEFKSCLTVAYRDPRLKKFRKETRTHKPWSAKELQFLLQHAGLMPRKWIMSELKRGNNVCHIKERLQSLGIASRNLQGLTLSQFRKAFGKDPDFYLKTQAGPDGGKKGSLPTRWKIVPWVYLDQELKAKRLRTSKELRLLISTHALFQEWIFEGDTLKKMKKIVKKRGGGDEVLCF